jgi:hypothetical protein
MLPGEGTREYRTRDGDSRAVCELCRVRAEAAGWIPAELAATGLPEREQNGRRRGRVRRLIERARESAASIGIVVEGPSEPEPGPEGIPLQAPGAPRPPQRETESPQPERAPPTWGRLRERLAAPAPQARPRRRRGIPQSPNRRIKRAFERFNETEYRSMVAGLIRSLGPPWVSAVTSAAAPAEVRITVAWELSWYQWEVDLAGDAVAVRELAKGEEVGQLDEEDRAWNARATEEGELRLGSGGDGGGG